MRARGMHTGYWRKMQKTPLGRPRNRLVDNIKMDLRQIGWDGMDWIDLAQDRDQWRALVNTVMNHQVPQNVGKFLSSCTTGSFSRKAQLHEVIYLVGVPAKIQSGHLLREAKTLHLS
jgi:hypothetical protein